jgi:hypothetical protein
MIECLIIKKEYIAAINDISTIGLYSCCATGEKKINHRINSS